MVPNCQSRKVQIFQELWLISASSMKISQATQVVSNTTRYLCSGSWITSKHYIPVIQHLKINSCSALYWSTEELWQILYQMSICSVKSKNFEEPWWRGKGGEYRYNFCLFLLTRWKKLPSLGTGETCLTSNKHGFHTESLLPTHIPQSQINFSMYITLLLHIYDHLSTASYYIPIRETFLGFLLGFLFFSLLITLSFQETIFGELSLRYALFNFSVQCSTTIQYNFPLYSPPVPCF